MSEREKEKKNLAFVLSIVFTFLVVVVWAYFSLPETLKIFSKTGKEFTKNFPSIDSMVEKFPLKDREELSFSDKKQCYEQR